MALYHVFTEKSGYGCVLSPAHFAQVRAYWKDYSPCRDVFRWNSERGEWERVETDEFEPKEDDNG